MLTFVLEELRIAEIRNEDITIIGATGAHRMMNKDDFKIKVGNNIFIKIVCISHNPFEGNKFIGKTLRGTPVSINEKVYNSKNRLPRLYRGVVLTSTDYYLSRFTGNLLSSPPQQMGNSR